MGAIEGGKLSSGKDEIGMSLGFSAADYSAILLSLKSGRHRHGALAAFRFYRCLRDDVQEVPGAGSSSMSS